MVCNPLSLRRTKRRHGFARLAASGRPRLGVGVTGVGATGDSADASVSATALNGTTSLAPAVRAHPSTQQYRPNLSSLPRKLAPCTKALALYTKTTLRFSR